jgi:DNA-binding NarL/FixJ family response regulator
MLSSDPGYVLQALQAGAAGYIVEKSFIQEATAGDPLTRLSSRERQVLQLLAKGHTSAEIASTLSLSPKSVETYRARMERKLGLHDLASLVKFAIRNGVTSIE